MKISKFYLIVVNLVFFSFLSNLNGQDTLYSMQLKDTLNQMRIQFKNTTFTNDSQQFNFQNRSISNKFWRAMGYSSIYNLGIGIILVSLPDDITQWHATQKFQLPYLLNQFKNSFSSAPVIDHDYWYLNYIGHPYQGAFYYNSFRCQGASFWQSTFFNLGQTVIWEYIWESGFENPSIQDLIVTPVIGSLLGELTHRATLSMRKNGFLWYEKVAVCIINPAFAINNGFKTNNRKK